MPLACRASVSSSVSAIKAPGRRTDAPKRVPAGASPQLAACAPDELLYAFDIASAIREMGCWKHGPAHLPQPATRQCIERLIVPARSFCMALRFRSAAGTRGAFLGEAVFTRSISHESVSTVYKIGSPHMPLTSRSVAVLPPSHLPPSAGALP